MPALRGPLRGPVRGPVRAHQATGGGGGTGGTIYDATDATAVNTALQALAGTTDDLTPAALWTCDEAAGSLVDSIGGVELAPMGIATTVASPHGRAAHLDAAIDFDDQAWKCPDPSALDVGAGAFAVLVRVRVTATPGGFIYELVGKGSPAGAHWRLNAVGSDGTLQIQAKQSGGPTLATTTGEIADGAYHWILGGRSITAEKLWAAIDGEAVESAFSAANRLSNASGFMLGQASASGPVGDVDHVLVFTGDAAENVYAHATGLIAALEAAE